MSNGFKSWYKSQETWEADRLLDIIHIIERLNLSYAMRSEILRQNATQDDKLISFSLFMDRVLNECSYRYKLLTETSYVFKQKTPVKKDIWKYERLEAATGDNSIVIEEPDEPEDDDLEEPEDNE